MLGWQPMQGEWGSVASRATFSLVSLGLLIFWPEAEIEAHQFGFYLIFPINSFLSNYFMK
jgi:hypothetical protein